MNYKHNVGDLVRINWRSDIININDINDELIPFSPFPWKDHDPETIFVKPDDVGLIVEVVEHPNASGYYYGVLYKNQLVSINNDHLSNI